MVNILIKLERLFSNVKKDVLAVWRGSVVPSRGQRLMTFTVPYEVTESDISEGTNVFGEDPVCISLNRTLKGLYVPLSAEGVGVNKVVFSVHLGRAYAHTVVQRLCPETCGFIKMFDRWFNSGRNTDKPVPFKDVVNVYVLKEERF